MVEVLDMFNLLYTFAELNDTEYLLQIGVRQRGCNGLTYTLEYAQNRAKFDEEVVQVTLTSFSS